MCVVDAEQQGEQGPPLWVVWVSAKPRSAVTAARGNDKSLGDVVVECVVELLVLGVVDAVEVVAGRGSRGH